MFDISSEMVIVSCETSEIIKYSNANTDRALLQCLPVPAVSPQRLELNLRYFYSNILQKKNYVRNIKVKSFCLCLTEIVYIRSVTRNSANVAMDDVSG